MVHIHNLLYGDKTKEEKTWASIKDSTVRDRFIRAIEQNTPMAINNDNLGGDPDVGHVKACVIDYEENGIHRIRRQDEYNNMDFSWDITKWSYGASKGSVSMGVDENVPITRYLFEKLDHSPKFTVSNDLLGKVADPAYGEVKTLSVSVQHFVNGNAQSSNPAKQEGQTIDLKGN